jgi:hypothetical protein
MGDTREDGRMFRTYLKQIASSGYYYEIWEEEKLFFLNKTKRKLYNREHLKTAMGRAKQMLGICRASSTRRNIEYKLTIEDILPAVETGVCQLTGIPFDFSPHLHKKFNPYAPSIDRIDNERGYAPGNVRVVLWLVNAALGECSDEEALPILKSLVNSLEKNVKQNKPTPVPENHLGQSQTNSQLGAVLGAGSGQDCDGAHHYRGEPEGKDADYSAQARCRICLGSGMFSVGTSECHEMLLSNGIGSESIEDTAKRLGCVCYQCGECCLVD